jgi:LysW-gamma-L-lysine carboxypeptidase
VLETSISVGHQVDFLKKVLEIYSPSGFEDNISSFLAEEMEKIGFDKVWRNKVGNVYGEVGSGSPSILLCGHIDTVPGWIPVKIEGDKIYGRGAVDAKSSLSAMIMAAAGLKSSMSSGRIIVAGVVDEERGGRGIRSLLKDGLSFDCAIFGEPSGVKNVTFAYKGHIKLRVEFRTVTGHVGAQHLLPNAIEKCFEFWIKFKGICENKHRSPYGVFYSLTPSVVKILGKGSTNSVPDVCFMNIDIRLPPAIKCKKALEIIREIIEEFRRDNLGLEIGFKILGCVEPYVADRGNIVIRALSEAIREETGDEAKLMRKTGTGDMNILGARLKLPAATYGPGDSGLSHTFNEYIGIQEYLTSIRIYRRAVEKILKLSMH